MINATEVNEENALFHSLHVNGGQAITHGKDLSSCTQAGNAVTAQPARLSHRAERQRQRRRSNRENCHYRARGAAALRLRREEQNCRARMEGKECDWKNDSLSTDFVQKPQK